MDTTLPTLSPVQALLGQPIHPISRVRIMTDKDFELLVEAWAETLKGQYAKIAHFGSAGDKGIDVAGFCDAKRLQGVLGQLSMQAPRPSVAADRSLCRYRQADLARRQRRVCMPPLLSLRG